MSSTDLISLEIFSERYCQVRSRPLSLRLPLTRVFIQTIKQSCERTTIGGAIDVSLPIPCLRLS